MDTFKTISIGGVPRNHLLQQLIEAGIQFNAYAKTLFEHPTFSPDLPPERATLVKLKTADLGLKNPYSLETAVMQASKLGLRPCPLYLAAFLRMEYLDQPEGPYLCNCPQALVKALFLKENMASLTNSTVKCTV